MSLLDLPKHIKRRLVKEYINPKLFKKNIEYLVKENYIKIIKIFKLTSFHKNKILCYACRYGQKEIVELMISEGADDWNRGLYGACQGGNMDMVELMISKGANNWDLGFGWACKGGNVKITELMISKNTNNCDNVFTTILIPNPKKLRELTISRREKIWDMGLCLACSGGHIDVAKLMISKGANKLDKAIEFCQIDTMKDFILSKMPK